MKKSESNDDIELEHDIQSDKLLEEFAKMQNKSDLSEILKELFNEKKINMISELTNDETKLVTRISVVANKYDLKLWNSILENFLKNRLSKDRKSRQEIIEAVKGYFSPLFPNKSQQGLFNRGRNMGGGNMNG